LNEYQTDLGDPSLLCDPTYHTLLQSLNQKYKVLTEEVSFGELEFFFTKVAEPNDVALDLDENGELLWQPYWAEDWESSRALCWLLLEHDIAGQRVLDLGCGLGLTGAVAASQQAKVCLVDNAKPALAFSEINCWKWKAECQFDVVDWKSNESKIGEFDLIVGAEIIYDDEDWPFLSEFWKRHLKTTGRVMLCDPYRKTGREFRSWILKHGWSAVFRDKKIPDFERPVNVIELQKR